MLNKESEAGNMLRRVSSKNISNASYNNWQNNRNWKSVVRQSIIYLFFSDRKLYPFENRIFLFGEDRQAASFFSDWSLFQFITNGALFRQYIKVTFQKGHFAIDLNVKSRRVANIIKWKINSESSAGFNELKIADGLRMFYNKPWSLLRFQRPIRFFQSASLHNANDYQQYSTYRQNAGEQIKRFFRFLNPTPGRLLFAFGIILGFSSVIFIFTDHEIYLFVFLIIGCIFIIIGSLFVPVEASVHKIVIGVTHDLESTRFNICRRILGVSELSTKGGLSHPSIIEILDASDQIQFFSAVNNFDYFLGAENGSIAYNSWIGHAWRKHYPAGEMRGSNVVTFDGRQFIEGRSLGKGLPFIQKKRLIHNQNNFGRSVTLVDKIQINFKRISDTPCQFIANKPSVLEANFWSMRGNKFLVSEVNGFFRYTPKMLGRKPEANGRATQDQSEKSGKRLAIVFKKTTNAASANSEQAKDEGNTIFRLIAVTAVIGVVYALLKYVGKKDNGARNEDDKKGDDP
jgi:hypothetical protein